MNEDCIKCHKRNINKLVEKHISNIARKAEHTSRLTSLMHNNLHESNVCLSTLIHREARCLLKSDDFYQKEKDFANHLLLNKYPQWQKLVADSQGPLYTAMKLAIIGNIIDYGAHSVPEDIEQYIHDKLSADVTLDHADRLFESIERANSILYLGDNAGEIVFDRLFIETMGHRNVTFAVRGRPIINDVTVKDAELVGMNNTCQVISNGYDAPSTLFKHCSPEFKRVFASADLIISKGQGNFEGLMDNHDPRLYFLLTAKCDYIGHLLKVKKGDLVVANAHTISE